MRGGIKECTYNKDANETVIKTNSTDGLHEESYVKISYIKCHTENYCGDGKKFKIIEVIKGGFKIAGKIDIDVKKHKYSWSVKR